MLKQVKIKIVKRKDRNKLFKCPGYKGYFKLIRQTSSVSTKLWKCNGCAFFLGRGYGNGPNNQCAKMKTLYCTGGLVYVPADELHADLYKATEDIHAK